MNENKAINADTPEVEWVKCGTCHSEYDYRRYEFSCPVCGDKDKNRPCTCHPGDTPRPCPSQFALAECVQRQIEIEQLAQDLYVRYSGTLNNEAWDFAIEGAEYFWAQIDKRRAAK